MKSIRSLIKYLLLALFIASCTEEYLETNPYGLQNEDTYYSTDEEVRKGLNAAYDFLVRDFATSNDESEGAGYSSSFMMRCIASDNGNAGGGNPQDIEDWQQMDEFRTVSSNGSLLQHWQRSYFGIYRCNLLLDREYDEMSDELVVYLAEARFLRAYYYWELVTFFGGVPVVDWIISTADPYPPRNTEQEVWTFIETDLTAAIEDLPLKSQRAPSERQRASKGAARALLAKAYMFREKYSDAAQVLEDLFDSYEYELDSSYAHIFALDGEFGTESIFEISYTSSFGGEWDGNRSRNLEGNVNSQLMGVRGLSSNSYYFPGWGFNKVELDLIEAFDSENDSIRKYSTAYGDEFFTEHDISYTDNYKNTGWWCKKMAPDNASFGDGDGAPELDYQHNEVVLRLADMYLLYAEAQFRLGNEGVTREYINRIRFRVNLPDLDGGLSGQALFDALVKERRLELAMEGHRYFDLIRWGLAAQVLQNQWGGSFDPNVHTVFPVPQQEISRSGGVLKQNTGY
ncbi:MAG: RagB/SusD family nutrient uptake outer membrane protein [Bacteroidales bacterium]|jgi:hypothetical protein